MNDKSATSDVVITQHRIETLLADNYVELSHEDRLVVIDQAQILLAEFYVHLFQKEASKAILPLQELRLLRSELEERALLSQNPDSAAPMSNIEFHKRMLEIFLAMKDRHTQYIPWYRGADATAQLPFYIRRYRCICNDKPVNRYVVSLRDSALADYAKNTGVKCDLTTFEHAVEVTHWNGVAIETAIAMTGDGYYGANEDAHRAAGIYHLTNRNLDFARLPTEELVTLTFIPHDKKYTKPREIQFPWVLNGHLVKPAGLGFGKEFKLTEHESQLDCEARCSCNSRYSASYNVTTSTPDEILSWKAKIVLANDGMKYLYLRIFNFNFNLTSGVNELFEDYVKKKQKFRGLIIDIRGNPGGRFVFAEQLLRFLSPAPIEPTLFQVRPTYSLLELSSRYPMFSIWKESLLQGVRTGAQYSAALPRSRRSEIETRDTVKQSWATELFESIAEDEAITGRWKIPLCLVADARCYSAADIFAAGIADNSLGDIIGPDRVTGAGGAAVFGHKTLMDLYPDAVHPAQKVGQDPNRYIHKLIEEEHWVLAHFSAAHESKTWIVCMTGHLNTGTEQFCFRRFHYNTELFGDGRIIEYKLKLEPTSHELIIGDTPPIHLREMLSAVEKSNSDFIADDSQIVIRDKNQGSAKIYRYRREQSVYNLTALPGISLDFSLFRVIRSGQKSDSPQPNSSAGIPLEDIGVKIEQIHPTRADVCTDPNLPEVDMLAAAI